MSNSNLSTTAMCIYIDKTVYTDKFDENQVFEYLKSIIKSLAYKTGYFTSAYDYDNYASYTAERVYLRLVSSRQNLDETHPKYVKRIKSILNYIKSVMYVAKLEYQRMIYEQAITDEIKLNSLSYSEKRACTNTSALTGGLLDVEISAYINTLNKTIRKVIDDTPYCKDEQMCKRLYMSCLMTLIRGVTLSNKNLRRYSMISRFRVVSQSYVDSLYNEEQLRAPICWRLPIEFIPFIKVLATRVKEIMIKDIGELVKDFDYPEDILKAAITANVDFEEE